MKCSHLTAVSGISGASHFGRELGRLGHPALSTVHRESPGFRLGVCGANRGAMHRN
jgi:hypothetical protein